MRENRHRENRHVIPGGPSCRLQHRRPPGRVNCQEIDTGGSCCGHGTCDRVRNVVQLEIQEELPGISACDLDSS